jgi:hypothetical protein
MKRRRFVQSLVAAPTASALLAQTSRTPANPPGAPLQQPAAVAQDLPKIDVSVPDIAADPAPRFFNEAQFAALRHLCEILMPAGDGRPGAIEARAPEFLDFLIGESLAERQQLYRDGLDALNSEANRRYGKPFATISAADSDAILAPLRQPWQYNPPSDPLAHFLVQTKADIRTATVNSHEYVSVAGAGSRRFGGVGLYWHSLD